tara:strand:- start:838 stop:1098 length:261 start_codon:yes stop_codon:yes gene_type:complete
MKSKNKLELLKELIEATEVYSKKVESLINTKEQVGSEFDDIILQPNQDRRYKTNMRIELMFLLKRLKVQNWDFINSQMMIEIENAK